MTVLAAVADGNLTTAGTWALVDATSYLNTENVGAGVDSTESSNRAAAGFTPGAITIDAIAVKISSRSLAVSGTFSVQLYNLTDAAVVTGTSVTVNATDVTLANGSSIEGGWFVMKLAAPVTLVAGKSYIVSPVCSSIFSVSLYRSATAGDWARALRTTTNQAPVAGDDLIVAGEHTGAGTGNRYRCHQQPDRRDRLRQQHHFDGDARNRSMQARHLEVQRYERGQSLFAGFRHVIVYNGGELDVGTVATPIPRDSVAVLEFDCTADGDFGLIVRNGGTYTSQGLSRTSGKNVVSAKLTADSPVNLMQAIVLSVQPQSQRRRQTTTLDPTGTSLGRWCWLVVRSIN
jgi:hypothetical protein